MAETVKYFNLTVLTGILNDPLIAAYKTLREDKTESSKQKFLHELFDRQAEENFSAYVSEIVLQDDNAFSRACAAGKSVSPYLQSAYINDLKEIGKALDFSSDDFEMGFPHSILRSWDDKTANLLYGYYQSGGYGQYLYNRVFRYEKNGKIVPVHSPVSVQLSDLKGYEEEKARVYDNIENFVKGLPCSDMLLYGDRGTGKSSTIHAMAETFFSQKLRLVEVAKEFAGDLALIKDQLSRIPLRFLVFIDDFSIGEKDDRVSGLKAALQGGAEHSDNVMIAATSNRRHIVEENFESREASVHAAETEQELLSLSERFGVTVLFSATDKARYLEITRELAKDKKLKISNEELDSLAERFALTMGGRSPRRAKQLIGYLYACQKKGKEFNL